MIWLREDNNTPRPRLRGRGIQYAAVYTDFFFEYRSRLADLARGTEPTS